MEDFATGIEAARHLRERGPHTVVVGAGPDGDVVVGDRLELRLPRLPLGVVHATGAGDAFVGALTALLASGVPVQDAAVRASAAAPDTAARFEARPRFSRATLEELVRRHLHQHG